MPEPAPKKPVAAIVTVYEKRSHADVFLSKLLTGYLGDGGAGPGLTLAAVYVDQFREADLSRGLARKHGFRLCKTIAEAVTLGGTTAVDGVLILGEHGDYPTNDLGQILYPRRKFFAETMAAFEAGGRSVPVFNDKHLSATWADAKWVYDTARAECIPLMAGSSIPVTWRKPELKLPLGCALADAVQLGYGPIEGYGFHALEGLQCMVERRKGGETGVKAVQTLTGPAMWKAMDAGRFSKPLLEAAIARVPAKAKGDYRELTAKAKDAGIILIEYRDGFRAAVAMLNGYLYEGDGGAFAFAGRVAGEAGEAGEAGLRSCAFYLQQPEPFAHFGYVVRGFESMVRTGHAPYPAERTLLTTGVLAAAMASRHAGGKRVETPHLGVTYKPTDWPFATDPIPKGGAW